MFKDMELSKDINNAFKQYLNHSRSESVKIDLVVNVLSMAFWPTYPVLQAWIYKVSIFAQCPPPFFSIFIIFPEISVPFPFPSSLIFFPTVSILEGR